MEVDDDDRCGTSTPDYQRDDIKERLIIVVISWSRSTVPAMLMAALRNGLNTLFVISVDDVKMLH
jgi:hypothetical protein